MIILIPNQELKPKLQHEKQTSKVVSRDFHC